MPGLRCVLLDDELPGLTYLKMLCGQIEGIEVVKAYNNPQKFLHEADQLDFQVCVLDIEMPGMNGLEVAQKLKDKVIIFSTAYKEYAADAFDLEAADYITKPLQLDRLKKAFLKAERLLEQREGDTAFTELNSDRGKLLLRFADVVLVSSSEVDRRDKKVTLKSNQELILKNISFEQLLEKLPADRFCRINRQTIISLDCVAAYTHDSVVSTLSDHDGISLRFPLSIQFSSAFKEKVKA